MEVVVVVVVVGVVEQPLIDFVLLFELKPVLYISYALNIKERREVNVNKHYQLHPPYTLQHM